MKPTFTYSRCGTRVVPTNTGLAAQVQQYTDQIRPHARAELGSFRRHSSLRAAVERAALAVDPDGKRYSHQRRITRKALAAAKVALVAALTQLQGCRSFDELLGLVDRLLADIFGLAELYSYDTALRIGAKLGLLPDRIYLHAGTREGAGALGLDHRVTALRRRDLPREIRQLQPHEIEDFLCIFKRRLTSPKRLTMRCNHLE